MKCYNHPEVDAVGLCKNCHKGVCLDCHATVAGSIACAGECEARVATIDRLLDRSIAHLDESEAALLETAELARSVDQSEIMLQKSGAVHSPALYFNPIAGLLFLSWGLVELGSGSFAWLIVGLGTLMLVTGVMSIVRQRRLLRELAAPEETR